MYLHTKRHQTSGFTLVELSIVIIILSLLTTSGLAIGTSMIERAAYLDTSSQLSQLDKTLHDYYIVHGRLPCPARWSTAPGTSNFGVEIDCETLGDPDTFDSGNVTIGMIPVRTLGLPDSAASDKYGSRIIYAVTESLTDADDFGDGVGAITIVDSGNNNILIDAAYAIYSHGRDRLGSRSYKDGSLVEACNTAGTLDEMNCEFDDANLRDAPFNDGDVAGNFFDDLIRWSPKYSLAAQDTQSTALWAATAGGDVYSVGVDGLPSTTNVGIGTDTPERKLHVADSALIDSTNDFLLYLRKPDGSGSYWNWALQDISSAGKLAFRARNTDWSYNKSLLTMDHTSGYVGIGADSPERKLHVADSALIDSTDDFYLYLRKPDGVGGYWNWALQDSGSAGILMFRARNEDWSFNKTLLSMDHTSGYVGIGTMSPSERLHVNGNLQVGSRIILDPSFTFNGNGASLHGASANDEHFTIYSRDTTSNGASITLAGRTHTLWDGRITYRAATDGTGGLPAHHFYKISSGGAATPLAEMQDDGDMWIKRDFLARDIYVTDIYAQDINYTGSLTFTSDKRLKKDIHPVENALKKLDSINGVYFRWNEKAPSEDKESVQIGVLAQDVQKVIPEAVQENDKGFLTIDKTALIPVLVEAVHELKAQNEALQDELALLRDNSGTAATSPPERYNPLADYRMLTALLLTALLSVGITMVLTRKS